MLASQIHDRLTQVLRDTSGLEQSRGYLGMSAIGRCPREAARSFLHGSGQQNNRQHQNAKRGYLIEGEFKMMLAAAGVLKHDTSHSLVGFDHATGTTLLGGERELIAPFDDRFRGHTDGETVDGELIEIKSMTFEKYGEARDRNRISPIHDAQVQVYMRYGDYNLAHVLYIATDSFDHWVYTVRRDDNKGAALEKKAKLILAAIDAQDATTLPCECGRCKDAETRYKQRDEKFFTAR